jgi:hypothetical protein
MRRKLIEWLIKKLCPGFHLHHDPVRKPAQKEEDNGLPAHQDGLEPTYARDC